MTNIAHAVVCTHGEYSDTQVWCTRVFVGPTSKDDATVFVGLLKSEWQKRTEDDLGEGDNYHERARTAFRALGLDAQLPEFSLYEPRWEVVEVPCGPWSRP